MPDLFSHHPPYARWAHILLRIVAGALFAQHGIQKLFGAFGGTAVPVGTLPWVAGIIETGGGILIILGLFTRIAAVIMAGEMAYAYVTVHFPKGLWPIINKGELALLFCFVFLYFAATGAGAFSLDYIRARRRPRAVMAT